MANICTNIAVVTSSDQSVLEQTIKEISEEVHLSESTVSRAIKDKYIKTNYGTFRIKDLFKQNEIS